MKGAGKFVLGSNRDESVRGQQKGAATTFNPKEPPVKSKGSPKTGSNGSSGKGYTPPPQPGGGRADKMAGTPGVKTAQAIGGVGGGRKLGNHYSNS